MRNTPFFIATLLFSLSACAQNPPKPVSDNFAEKFAGATNVKWVQEEENEWEAEFKLGGEKLSASFDIAGKWLETEVELNKKDLPSSVMDAIESTYNGWKIESVERIEKTDLNGYEIGIEKKGKELEIQVSADGKIARGNESGKEDNDGK